MLIPSCSTDDNAALFAVFSSAVKSKRRGGYLPSKTKPRERIRLEVSTPLIQLTGLCLRLLEIGKTCQRIMTGYFQGTTDVMLCLGNFVVGGFAAVVRHLIVMFAR